VQSFSSLGFIQETLSRLLVAHIEEVVLLSQTLRRLQVKAEPLKVFSTPVSIHVLIPLWVCDLYFCLEGLYRGAISHYLLRGFASPALLPIL